MRAPQSCCGRILVSALASLTTTTTGTWTCILSGRTAEPSGRIQATAGWGTATKADTITVRWPSGILQSEINAAADRIVRVKELDRKGTSCPLLYTWNGKEFEFVTDFLGGSAYGYLVAPGRYNTPDTDEYVLIQGKQLTPRDGQYVLNLNNQLEEVIMFDQAQLLVVDHPAGTEIYPNERLLPPP